MHDQSIAILKYCAKLFFYFCNICNMLCESHPTHPLMEMTSPQSLIWFECGLMSAWHCRWCQLDNDKIASDLSGIAFIVVIGLIHCWDVLKLCHALLGTLPFMLIGLATNCDRSHCWQTEWSTWDSRKPPQVTWILFILRPPLFYVENNIYIASQSHSHTKRHTPFHTVTYTHLLVPVSQTLLLPSLNLIML